VSGTGYYTKIYMDGYGWKYLHDKIVAEVTKQYILKDESGVEVSSGLFDSISSPSSSGGLCSLVCMVRDTSSNAFTFRTIEIWGIESGVKFCICYYTWTGNISKDATHTLIITNNIGMSGVEP
jgi:hypothetical protein